MIMRSEVAHLNGPSFDICDSTDSLIVTVDPILMQGCTVSAGQSQPCFSCQNDMKVWQWSCVYKAHKYLWIILIKWSTARTNNEQLKEGRNSSIIEISHVYVWQMYLWLFVCSDCKNKCTYDCVYLMHICTNCVYLNLRWFSLNKNLKNEHFYSMHIKNISVWPSFHLFVKSCCLLCPTQSIFSPQIYLKDRALFF